MTELDPLHFINVGPHGTFRASGQSQTTPAQIDALIDHLDQNAADKVVLYFHGGLVSESAGMQVAQRLTPLFIQAGSHPVSFVWETGLVETISRNLSGAVRTDLVQALLKHVLKRVAKRWGIDLAEKGPGEELTDAEIQAELGKPAPFADFDFPEQSLGRAKGGAAVSSAMLDAERPLIEEELEQDLIADTELGALVATEAANNPVLEDTLKDLDTAEAARGGLEVTLALAQLLLPVVLRSLQRHAKKLDHGLFPTVVEELLRQLHLADLGAWVWTSMKDLAQAMWAPNLGPVDANSRVGTYFLHRLAALKQKRPGLAIDLVGHSAGSIAICRLLAAAGRYPGLKVRHVIFLAPGCTMGLFHDEVVSKPERFETFRMYTMHDDFETRDILVPGVYSRSLVYFVSGVLEDEVPKPIAGLERWLRDEAHDPRGILAPVRAFMRQAGADRLVLSKTADTAVAGLRSLAVAHGAFDDDSATLESLQALIAN
jgi:hypothetical protein